MCYNKRKTESKTQSRKTANGCLGVCKSGKAETEMDTLSGISASEQEQRRKVGYSHEELKKFVDTCRRCSLCQTRNKAVMGKGNLHSPVLFIAEAPGASEDRDGIPFTGRSGVLFDRLLEQVGMSREEIYLTNVVKCHPPGNRDPRPEEQEACIPYLKYETLLLRPRIIVCLGRIAAQRIIRQDYRITREHGTFLFRKNVWLTAVYHPSAILRDESKMEETIRDFQAIRAKIQECEETAAYEKR